MFQLKRLSKKGISAALSKVERYRLLNEPREAESICLDVLEIDPKNQKALVSLLLSITDQFGQGRSDEDARRVLQSIKGAYEKVYYEGIICERMAKTTLRRGTPGSESDAYEWLRDAMANFAKAEKVRPKGNDNAILRWNSCARIIMEADLTPRAEDKALNMLE